MRPEIAQLAAMGPFPSERAAAEAEVEAREELLLRLEPPVTDHEASVLLRLLGEDSLFGLAWSIVSLIETAPGWPLLDEIDRTPKEWRVILKAAARNRARLSEREAK